MPGLRPFLIGEGIMAKITAENLKNDGWTAVRLGRDDDLFDSWLGSAVIAFAHATYLLLSSFPLVNIASISALFARETMPSVSPLTTGLVMPP